MKGNTQKKSKTTYLYGKHALAEALRKKPDCIGKVFLAAQFDDNEVINLLKKHHIPFGALSKNTERTLGDDAAHQGVIATFAPERLMVSFSEFIETCPVTPDTSLVLFDELEDPHNVGAVIRSAAAFGVAGVLIPEHRQAPITGTVVKVSVGMAFAVPLVRIGNINDTLRTLKEKGFWVYGLAMDGEPLPQTTFDAPSVFVLGNEGKGIRAKTLELCDVKLSIPMSPRCESLNAAQAATVALYAWSVQHPHL